MIEVDIEAIEKQLDVAVGPYAGAPAGLEAGQVNALHKRATVLP